MNRLGNSLRCSAIGLFVYSVLLLAGCTVGPKYRQPSVPTPPAYKEVGNWRPAQPNDQRLGGSWWEIFNDPLLNSLEAQVNVNNQNLKAAEAQFRQARALFRYNRADKFPTVTAGASAVFSGAGSATGAASFSLGASALGGSGDVVASLAEFLPQPATSATVSMGSQ